MKYLAELVEIDGAGIGKLIQISEPLRRLQRPVLVEPKPIEPTPASIIDTTVLVETWEAYSRGIGVVTAEWWHSMGFVGLASFTAPTFEDDLTWIKYRRVG